MRYDNWDVIVFPRDSHVPIQEFKTICYATQDKYGRELPTLTCYIASLPATCPFRVSIHSWATIAKPSAIIESQRKKGQRVVFAVQVIVDGSRVFHGLYDASSKWPQEIVSEKRSIGFPDVQSSQRRPCLEFPHFRQNILMRSSWDARDDNGRIKVLLSEQLVNKTSTPGEFDFGPSNDIICFAFQHAPRDVLEQAGISWPIRNPLYIPSGELRGFPSQVPLPYMKMPDPSSECKWQHPMPMRSNQSHANTFTTDPYPRPKTGPPPQFPQFPIPPLAEKSNIQPSIWDDNLDDISMMDTWSTQQGGGSSHSTAATDITMADLISGSPLRPKTRINTAPWNNDGSTSTSDAEPHRHRRSGWDDARKRSQRLQQQVTVTLRDDQLGQIIEALSPPKVRARDTPHASSSSLSAQFHTHGHVQSAALKQPPAGGGGGQMGPARPSAAALERKASYADFTPRMHGAKRHSPDDKTANPLRSASAKENRPLEEAGAGPQQQQQQVLMHLAPPPTFPFAARVPTPHPLAPTVGKEGTVVFTPSDVSMRDPSSVADGASASASTNRRMFPPHSASTTAPAATVLDKSSPAPDLGSSVRSRKEGRARREVADASAEGTVDPSRISTAGRHGEGGGSEDSTVRLERRLYSALGEELGGFEGEGGCGGVGGMTGVGEMAGMMGMQEETREGAQCEMEVEDEELVSGVYIESPVAKRKRQGTFGAERGRSPVAKVGGEVRLRGG